MREGTKRAAMTDTARSCCEWMKKNTSLPQNSGGLGERSPAADSLRAEVARGLLQACGLSAPAQLLSATAGAQEQPRGHKRL